MPRPDRDEKAAMTEQEPIEQRGDAQPSGDGGLTVLFDRHRAELLRFLRARCTHPEDAEDLLQDLWLKVSTLAPGPIANGRAYMFRMANNLVLDGARARHRAMTRDHGWLAGQGRDLLAAEHVPDPTPDAEAHLADRQEAEVLARAIENLPPGARRALRLHRFDGLGQADVAAAMGISRSGVEKHLALAMKHLRRALCDCGLFAATASDSQEQARGGEPRKERGQ
jgi:RNA polymerase sigma-70 factor (ECF subfamily)